MADEGPEILGYHHPDYRKNFRGCNVHFPHYYTLDEVEQFQTRPDDVAICGFPKSGSVWFCAVVGMIMHDADPAFMTELPVLEKKVPFLEFSTAFRENGYRGVDALNRMPGPRIFFSHLKFELLPKNLLTSGAKVIYKCRNPKDSLISLHSHHLARPASQYHGTLDDMVNEYSEDTVPFGPYFDHMVSFWRHRDSPNIFFTSYEALHKEPETSIRNIATFLGKSLTEQQVATIFSWTKFDAMKNNPIVNRVDKVRDGIFDFKIVPFMRRGQMDAFRDELTSEQITQMDSWIERNRTRSDLQGLPALQYY